MLSERTAMIDVPDACRGSILAEIRTEIDAEWVADEIPAALCVFAHELAGGGSVSLPASPLAQRVVMESMADTVERAGDAGDWSTAAAVAALIAETTREHGIDPPTL